MQVLVNVIFQIDEARRYILDGRLQQLRLSLLLLDNAAEILMDHRVQTDRENSAVSVRLKERAIEINEMARDQSLPDIFESSPELKALLDVPTQTKEKREKIDRRHGDKVNFLAQSGGPLTQDLAGALKHLHTYRNEGVSQLEGPPGDNPHSSIDPAGDQLPPFTDAAGRVPLDFSGKVRNYMAYRALWSGVHPSRLAGTRGHSRPTSCRTFT